MMEGWKEYRFDKIANFPPKIKMKKGEMWPFIPMENISGGYKFAKPLVQKELTGGGAKFEEGDTLFARITPCLENGKISQAKGLNGKAGFGSTEYFIFRGKEGISDTDFIYYLSKTHWFRQNAINSMVGASGRQRADAGFVSRLKVMIPPLSTQRKIASILSAYDDLIENNLKRIKLLEEKAQLTYEEWFVRMKFPGHESTPIDKATGLPEGWEKGKIIDLFELQRGFDLPIQNREEGSIPVLASTGIVDYHSYEKVKGPGIVTGRSGTIGEVQFVANDFWPLNTTLWIKKYKKGNPAFALQFLRTIKLKRFAGGSAVPSLDRKVVHHQSIKIPTLGLINQYETFCNPILTTIENYQNQYQLLKEARDILLPRLMTGMVDVEDMDLGNNFI